MRIWIWKDTWKTNEPTQGKLRTYDISTLFGRGLSAKTPWDCFLAFVWFFRSFRSRDNSSSHLAAVSSQIHQRQVHQSRLVHDFHMKYNVFSRVKLRSAVLFYNDSLFFIINCLLGHIAHSVLRFSALVHVRMTWHGFTTDNASGPVVGK